MTIALSIFAANAFAQSVERITQREIQRRQASLSRGQEALVRGQAAMQEKNFAAAHEEFRNAVALLPDGAVSDGPHDEAIHGFCQSGVRLAEQRIAEGKYSEAEFLVREVLDPRYDPNCRPATELLAKLQTPGYFNQTMGSKFIAKVEEVKRLLNDADGYYKAGRYDLAFKKYDQVLALDPYNTAARKGQEQINLTRYQYNQQAYNETRSRQLWQVEKSWEEPIKGYGVTTEPTAEILRREISGTARINQKLNSIIIPKIEFRDASIREAIEFLRQQAIANDPATEGQRGVNIVLRARRLGEIAPPLPPPAATVAPAGTAAPEGTATTPAPAVPATAPVAAPEAARLTISLNDIPLGEALRYIANQVGLKVKVEPHAVLLIPISEQSSELVTKRYHVPPEFFGGPLDVGYYLGTATGGQSLGQAGGSQSGGEGTISAPVASQVLEKNALRYESESQSRTRGLGTGYEQRGQSQAVETTASTRQQLANDRQLVGRADAKIMLQSMGVDFPPGASASFWPHSGALIVRNTQDNLDMVDALVEQANASGPKQVAIESKFIEITQTNLKELGFDWLLGQFNIGNHKIFGSGGTIGNQPAPGANNYPFVDPATGQPIGQFPVTGGNRSGSFALGANALDALLSPTMGASTVAPGIFGLSGVFTDPQFQVVIRALSQKKGVDLLSSPRVTTKSGQRAIIEVVREFRYPSRYTPPQVPSIGTTTTTGSQVVPVVVTPTTPADWETRNTGVTLEVEPVVGQDGNTIDLNLVPQVVEFEGFINYGSPINAIGINTTAGGLIANATPIPLTQNVINQPVFSTRKVTTSVQVADGQTVVLGGLIREDVQKVEDRTPFVGDLPLVGRLFRTNVDQHVKRNLIIFVTARQVTAFGQPLEDEEEGPEQIEQPVLPEIPAYKK